MKARSDGHDHMFRCPDGISDDVAATLPVASRTATAALATAGVGAGDTVLVGGAAGGVGVFVVQLARLDGARVIGTCSESSFDFVRELGAEPVTYGPGLADRVLSLAPGGITAAIDLVGLETAETALALGVPPERVCTIAAGPNPPGGVRPTWGWDAPADTEHRVTAAITAGQLNVPIAATFNIERIREAANLMGGRHVHGKILVKPSPG
jgi:NADPH:quinone reductase-like Zn-dependent oxidoreductase